MTERITVLLGDITQQRVDAIVNAANETLLGGGGVDGAIHRAAGPQLLAECRTLGGCPTGQARITKGYNLPAPWVIHTVGPVWHGGTQGEDDALASCYRSVFALMSRHELAPGARHSIATLAFPAISTGVYHFPVTRAAAIAVAQTRAFLAANQAVQEVRFVCFDEANKQAYEEELGG